MTSQRFACVKCPMSGTSAQQWIRHHRCLGFILWHLQRNELRESSSYAISLYSYVLGTLAAVVHRSSIIVACGWRGQPYPFIVHHSAQLSLILSWRNSPRTSLNL